MWEIEFTACNVIKCARKDGRSLLLFPWIHYWRPNFPWGWSSVTPDSACFSLLGRSFCSFWSFPAAPRLCFHHLFGTWLPKWPVRLEFIPIQSSENTVVTEFLTHSCRVVFSSWATARQAGQTRLPPHCQSPFLDAVGRPSLSSGLDFLLGSSLW